MASERRTDKNNKMACSFCGRDKSEALILISGINGYICEACTAQAVKIVDEELYGGKQKKSEEESKKMMEELEFLKKELSESKVLEKFEDKQEKIISTELVTSIGVIKKTEIELFIQLLIKEKIISLDNGNLGFSEIMDSIIASKKRELKYFKETCFERISNAETKEVISLLMQFSNDAKNISLRKEILQISSKWSALTKDIRKGIIKPDDASLELNKISAALIEIVEQLEHL